ncbi:Uncharacterised protein [Klebsiella pneumoniae]|uniref:Uncharacterized protein n=3 Tax=Klebsiella pneumoniae TaxID=573 RepID=A0A378AAZ6_KLEPO|nr:Uncharacterised protein [Klebsiella pneumoniae]STV04687.1 Uncharacterised protein [Klebsiella pneumoniae subsp. ozaenae]STS02473.1 Uncharacterised protein [Klebsiella pneumoniae]STT96362.1 Uncharacterised protein [Klebsiella pneumoniae]STU24683.1 Uncharacterised protein [Klebsiella pneumoniae]
MIAASFTDGDRDMRRLIFSIALAIAVAGCSNTSGLSPVSGVDRYSNSKTVYIQPHGTDCQSMQCIMLGAFWTEADKDKALLTISLANSTDFISSAWLEVDGKRYELRNEGDLTRYSTMVGGSAVYVKSSKDFIVPLSVIKDITKAKKAWIFVKTGTGSMSNAIIDAQGDSKAYYALQRFVSSLPN